MRQVDLFEHVLGVYAEADRPISNSALYRLVGQRAGIEPEEWGATAAIGKAGAPHSPLKRRVRWWQQSAKLLGLLERQEGARGVWRITPRGKKKLTPAAPGQVLLGFSTDLGVALWAAAQDVFSAIDTPITLCLSSLPYPLAVPRAYGNPRESEYVDWAVRLLEPIAKLLVPGGSICLNLSNDIFLSGTPARSLYLERLTIALHERLGLYKMDVLIWEANKQPGPLRWASITRQQLNVGFEPVLWLTNNPNQVKADNRRVLLPHTEQHKALMARGGERRVTSYGDGAHRLRKGSFANATAGRIPRNVLKIATNCDDKKRTRDQAAAEGLPVHGAMMPLALADFLIRFLTEEGDVVADCCAGWMTTARAAESLGRGWIATELMGEYVLGGGIRFRSSPGFQMFGELLRPGLPVGLLDSPAQAAAK